MLPKTLGSSIGTASEPKPTLYAPYPPFIFSSFQAPLYVMLYGLPGFTSCIVGGYEGKFSFENSNETGSISPFERTEALSELKPS